MKMKVLENVMIIQILEKFISKNFLNVKVISKNIQIFPKEKFFCRINKKDIKPFIFIVDFKRIFTH